MNRGHFVDGLLDGEGSRLEMMGVFDSWEHEDPNTPVCSFIRSEGIKKADAAYRTRRLVSRIVDGEWVHNKAHRASRRQCAG